MTVLGIITPFEVLSPSQGQVIYALLTRPPLYSAPEGAFLVRLACLIHAANVRSEPGSNPSLDYLGITNPPATPHDNVLRRYRAGARSASSALSDKLNKNS